MSLQKGSLPHENGRHSQGWVSMRDSLDLKHIERGRAFPKWWAKHPSTYIPVSRMQTNYAKQKHYHVLHGYWDKDFVTPHRFYGLGKG